MAANADYNDKLARAKILAAKFATGSGQEPAPAAPALGAKRPFGGDNSDSPQIKKDKVAQAAEAAARLAQKLGSVPSQPPLTNANGRAPGPFGDSNVTTVTYCVPDKFVGLIIGKKGEQISAIQAETSCKVQIAQESNNSQERQVTLTGSDDQINRAKEVLNDIITKAASNQFNNPNQVGGGSGGGGGGAQGSIEILVPGTKVGLIIGKNGDTIKQLQEETGVKMVMIQDSNAPSQCDKPLRISGEPAKIEQARQMVMELLSSKDMGFNANRGGGGFQEVRVPRRAVGIVIGRGGEMLRKLSEETGARVQFRQEGGNDFELPERVCQVTGSPESVAQAVERVQHLVDSTLRGGPGGGPGGPGGPGAGMPRGPGGFGGPGGGGGGGDGSVSTTYAVPSEKAGLVIGKGGETIKEICRTTGAYVEIQKQPPPNPNIKVFNVSGSQHQVDSALKMICERAGIPPPAPRNDAPSSQGGYGNYSTQYPNSYGQPQQQQPQQSWGQDQGQWGGNQQQTQYPQQHAQQPQGNGTSAPATNMPAPAVNPSTGQPDYSAAWAQYYRQQGMHDYADAIIKQAQQGGGTPGQPAQQQQPVSQPQQSHPQQPPQQQQPVAQPVGQPGAPGQPGPGGQPAGYDYQQWQQYNQQWAQYNQQWQQWQQHQGAGGAPTQPPQQPAGPPR